MTVLIQRHGNVCTLAIANPPVNALSTPVRRALLEAVREVENDPAIRAVVLLGTGATFIAGADIGELDRAPEQPYLPDVITAIENSAKLWIAAIHGSALGGGLEVALGCSYRIAMRGASLGFPEVNLGLIPGAGGTVRTMRLISAEAAANLVTSGKPVKAVEARRLGLIDEIADGDLEAAALAFAGAALGRPRPQPLSARRACTGGPALWEAVQKDLASKFRGEPARLRALATLRNAGETGFMEAMAFERETFLALRASKEAAALRHVFKAERAAQSPPELKGIEPHPVKAIGVIGGGTMGSGIIAALRENGYPVLLIERDEAALARGLAAVRAIFDGAAKRGKISEDDVERRMSGVSGSTGYAALAGCDLIIEAVFEDMGVKREVFRNLDAVCRSDAILATNTSYLDPREIAHETSNPGRVIGLHFFSPAHMMKLLEIVPLPATAAGTLAAAFALAKKLGKIPVRAGICDGFIGNRILRTLRAQAERLLLAGCAPSDIDRAMREFGMPMGPFEAQDLGGLDIAAFQRKAARERGETPFAPVADTLCEAGRLGQKTGGGWYDYEKGSRNPVHSPAVGAILAEARIRAHASPRTFTSAEIADAVILPMVDEGARILGEGIARRAADIDLVEIHGYGFPRWRGGLMHDAEARGLSLVAARLLDLAKEGLAAPASSDLLTFARSGRFTT